jgi:hypothetical protein
MTGEHVDDCAMGPIYVPVYLAFNLGYNILIILILKYGSANILWLALTIMVPMGNVTFALDFIPKNKPLRVWDIIGLVAIMAGLFCYRFWNPLMKMRRARAKARRNGINASDSTASITVQPPITDGWPAAVTVPGAEVVDDGHVRTSSGSGRQQRLSGASAGRGGVTARGGDQEYRDQEDTEGADGH